MEEVYEQALDSAQLFRHLPLFTVEDKARFVHNSDFLIFEILQALETFYAELDHVKDLIVVNSSHDYVVRAFLGMRAKHKQVTIVFNQQRFQGILIVKRRDVVITCKCLAVRLLECAKILENFFYVG